MVVYRGPWKQVRDDDGHVLYRGQRMAVCEKTYRLMTDANGPYAGHIAGVEPLDPVSIDEAPAFNCAHAAVRSPKQTKGMDYHATALSDDPLCCDPATGCC